MMRFALSMFVLTLLAPQAWALGASYQDVQGPKDKAEKNTKGPHVKGPKDKAEKKTRGPQDKTEKRNGEPVAVPEPATITLLAAGAGVAMARKRWKNRQQR
jgi:PEP-CTERM motif